MIKLYHGDCLEKMKELKPASVDSIVTDPPYGLGFMGKKWDIGVPAVDVFVEALRVLKPGGHLLAFGGSRTYHRLACAIEDAGFEIRDQIMWVTGSGFPKSLNIGKAIDKAAGAEREVVGNYGRSFRPHANGGNDGWLRPSHEVCGAITAPATEDAKKWQGWGTALKPAHEPIVLARKPLDGTVAENVLEHGCGGLNIDGCRVEYQSDKDKDSATPQGKCTAKSGALAGKIQHNGERSEFERPKQMGRYPANLIHDGSDEATAGMGQAARYFYCAKASKKDRGEGNKHPTVKPTELMRYMCRLVTPPGGVVLDPFMGSGSTGKAAVKEGFKFIGIEKEKEYLVIANARIAHAKKSRGLLNSI